jgi:hypothetical protein
MGGGVLCENITGQQADTNQDACEMVQFFHKKVEMILLNVLTVCQTQTKKQ